MMTGTGPAVVKEKEAHDDDRCDSRLAHAHHFDNILCAT